MPIPIQRLGRPTHDYTSSSEDEEPTTTRAGPSSATHRPPPRPQFLRGSSSSSALGGSSGANSTLSSFSSPITPWVPEHRRTSSGEATPSSQRQRGPFVSSSPASPSVPFVENQQLAFLRGVEGNPNLFTPAGDVLPPIATSRSTTSLVRKQQQHVQGDGIHSWNGNINSSSTSSLASSSRLNHSVPVAIATPDHPPPPYTEVAAITTRSTASPCVPQHLGRVYPGTAGMAGYPVTEVNSASSSSSSQRLFFSAPPSHASSAVSLPSRSRETFGSNGGVPRSVSGSDIGTSSDEEEERRGAIYARLRKGKERAVPDPDGREDVGMSSAVHSREDGSLLERRAGVGADPTSSTVAKKSCLKTPGSSSASLVDLAPTNEEQHRPGIGVRFVRFTLGLGGAGKRGRREGSREREPKLICTTPGQACAGETETETDEPSQRRLPTARRPPSTSSFGFGGWRRSAPQPPTTTHLPKPGAIQPPPRAGSSPLRPNPSSSSLTARSNAAPTPTPSRFTPFLFEAFRLLSVVPAICGVLFSLWMIYSLGGVGSVHEADRAREHVQKYWRCVAGIPNSIPPDSHYASLLACGGGDSSIPPGIMRGPPVPGRVDWVVAAFWALLTAHHCLGLSTGLSARWRVYYTPASTLVRLLALQGICWPATHLTLSVVGGGCRPAAAWAVIGTCTAVSRSVQIWVTSNIVREGDAGGPAGDGDGETEDEVSNAEGSVDKGRDGEKKRRKRSPGAVMMKFVHAFAAAVGGGSSEGEQGDGASSEEDDDEDEDGGSVKPVPIVPAPPALVLEDDSMFESTDAESPPFVGGQRMARRRRRRRRRRQRERWWDWKEVGLKCVLPTGMVYFLMAWAEVLRREWGSWYHDDGIPVR